jgi:hypothetical protein
VSSELTLELASRFARIALGHVTREYPNKLDHVVRGPDDVRGPRALHPIFYGSFDWHSCVHGYWLLATVLRRFPEVRERLAIRALFDGQMTRANVERELAYAREAGTTFERPYGWAWLLTLVAELSRHETDRGRAWYAALAPLGEAFAGRFAAYLPNATYPVRAGTHGNSAFALALALAYARACDDQRLLALAVRHGSAWFAADADRQVWEPDGEDFLSPVLVEAECMRRILPPAAFATWLQQFLPELHFRRPAVLFVPATVSDRTDGRIAHLDGLNLSRAWCFRSISATLPATDPRVGPLRDAAGKHLAAALPQLSADYMGEHWLATFAALALTAPDP